jgi:hypothetical protein
MIPDIPKLAEIGAYFGDGAHWKKSGIATAKGRAFWSDYLLRKVSARSHQRGAFAARNDVGRCSEVD